MAKKLRIEDLEQKIVIAPLSRQEIEHSIRCKVLIVCEGSKTEPNYFQSFSLMKNSSSLVFEVVPDGSGLNTMAVVEKAIELRDKAINNHKPYDSVWAVFDRDSFPASNFNSAIEKAMNNDIGCAWSNEAFELWYVYHFENRCTPMRRTEYKNVITERVQKGLNDKSYVYQKNDKKMREILSKCGCDEDMAIRLAEQQANQFTDSKYHTHNPCTTVYKLVRLLLGKDKEFNKQIKESLEEK